MAYQPITWRSVTGYSPADASIPLLRAQQAVNQGFGDLTNLVSSADKNELQNWDAVKQANTQAFLDKLYAAKSPDQLATMQASGELDALKQAAGMQIDRAAIRGAEDNRSSTLINQTLENNRFADSSADRRDQPIADQITALAAAGKKAEAQSLLDSHPEIRLKAALAGAIVKGDRDAQTFDQQTKQAADNLLTSSVQRDVSKQNAGSQRIMANASMAQASNSKEQLKLSTMQHLSTMLTNVTQNLGELGSQSVGSADGSAAVLKGIEGAVQDPKQKEALIRFAGEAMGDPANKNVSVADMLSLALGQKDDRTFLGKWAGTNSYRGEDLSKALESLRKTSAFQDRVKTNLLKQQQLSQQALAFRKALFGDPEGGINGLETPTAPTATPSPFLLKK
jgi:hypothetical protein